MAILGVIGHILLIILKIVLILLLVVLALILLVLFLPNTYEAAAKGDVKNRSAAAARAGLRMFAGILKLEARLEKGYLRFRIRLFGFTLKSGGTRLFSADEAGRTPEKETEKAPEEEPEKAPEKEPEKTPEKEPEKTPEKEPEESPEPDERERPEPGEKEKPEPPDKKKPEPPEKKKPETMPGGPEFEPVHPESGHARSGTDTPGSGKSDSGRATAGSETGGKTSAGKSDSGGRKKFFGKKRKKSGRSGGRGSRVKEILKMLRAPENRSAVSLLKKQLFRVLRHIAPKELRLHGTIGTGDPALTAWIIGGIYMFYPKYADLGDIAVQGDMNDTALRGKFYGKGHFFLIVPAAAAVRLLLSRDVRQLIRRARGK